MKSSPTPSQLPLCLWIIADALALADLILRLTKGHIILDILYVPAAVTILFTAITLVYLRRYQKEQKAAKSETAAIETMAAAEATAAVKAPDGEQA